MIDEKTSKGLLNGWGVSSRWTPEQTEIMDSFVELGVLEKLGDNPRETTYAIKRSLLAKRRLAANGA